MWIDYWVIHRKRRQPNTSSSNDTFIQMKLNTAPVFIHFPAKGKPKKGDTFEVHRHGFDAEVMSRFVTERTGKIELSYLPSDTHQTSISNRARNKFSLKT